MAGFTEPSHRPLARITCSPPSATLGGDAERSNSDNFCPVLIAADVTSDGLVRYVSFTEPTRDAGGSHGQESPHVPDSAFACLFWCAYPITKIL